jgi:hypothetical protein
MQEDERSEPRRRFDGVVPYVRGPGWPSAATENDAPMNPWSKEHWNLTDQARLYKRDQAEANRLAQAAGHKDAMSARLKNAK